MESDQPDLAAALRGAAEARLAERQRAVPSEPHVGADRDGLLHELQVHRIELELQQVDRAALKCLTTVLQHPASTIQQFLDFALAQAAELTDSRLGYLLLHDELADQSILSSTFRAARTDDALPRPVTGERSDPGSAHTNGERPRRGRRRALWREALRQRRAIIVHDLWAARDLDEHSAELRTQVTVPIFDGERIVALVGVANKASGYDALDVQQLNLLMTGVWQGAEARRAEEPLVQTGDRAAAILVAAGDGILGIDTAGAHTFVNPAAARMLGYEVNELVGRPSHALWHHTRADGTAYPVTECPICAACQDGQIHQRRDEVFWRQDGTSFPVEYVSTPLRDGERVIGAVVAFQDITERLKSAAALAATEQTFRGLFESSRDAIIMFGATHCLDCNQATLDLFACADRAQFIKLHPADLSPPQQADGQDSRVAAEAHIAAALATGSEVFEWQHQRLDGTVFEAEVRLSRLELEGPPTMQAVIRDITERKRAERALRESDQRFRTLADSGQALIWTAGLDKACNYFNQPWLSFTGRRLEDELGDGWVEGVHPDDLDYCVETYVAAFDRREPFSMDYRLRRHDGEYCWIQDDGAPRYDSRGEFLGYIGHCLDITERRQAEQQLQQSEARRKALFETIPDPIWLKDPDGVYLNCNPGFERAFGASEADIVGKTDFDFVDADLAESFRKHDRLVIEAGQPSVYEEWMTFAADGYRGMFETVKTPLRDDQGELIGVLGISRDITVRKRTEEALRSRENLMQRVFELLPVGLWIADAEGTLVQSNPAAVQIWGAEFVCPMTDYSLFKGRRLPSREEIAPDDWALVHTLRDGVSTHDELIEIDRIDGQQRIILNYTAPVLDDAGVIEGAVVVNLDVTAQEQGAAKLTEQLDELRRWHGLTLGRESRVLELKGEVNRLLAQAGQPPRYASVEDDP